MPAETKKESFDYIIAGAGCAGLSLAVHMIASGNFSKKKILIIDRDLKRANDRTWCFWSTRPGLFEPVVYRKWEKLWFHGKDHSAQLDISPYQYRMIRGIDFYSFCLDTIRQQPNFILLHEPVTSLFSDETGTGAVVNGSPLYCNYIFNSIVFEKPALGPKEYWLLQHFKGWTIETDHDVFDEGSATLMDFRTSQEPGTAFCYVLPYSSRKALVEYTVFSPELLLPEAYDTQLREYIGAVLGIRNYQVIDEEFGAIPMTNFRFAAGRNRIINIGTAGGQTKGSSGYTFSFIQKHSAALVQQLAASSQPNLKNSNSRFHFYDSVLLNILQRKKLEGREIFTELFKNNPATTVLKFLDNETSLREELKIISSLPAMPFLKAAAQQVF